MSADASLIPAADGVTPETVDAYLLEVWPAVTDAAKCVEVSGRHAVIRREVPPASIRPGGFISGPTQFSMADMALWFAVFGAVGFEAMALTSELSIRFLRPAVGDTRSQQVCFLEKWTRCCGFFFEICKMTE